MIIRKLNKTQECTCTANLMKLGIGKSSPIPYLLIPTIVLIGFFLFLFLFLLFLLSELSQVVHRTDSG